MKKITISIFIFIIYIPIILGVMGKVIGKRLDAQLKGFTDSVSRPELTLDNYFDGSLQSGYSAWLETKVPLRGVYTKTYNSINYHLFNLGNRPIGEEGYIYEPAYLNTELGIGETYDYSLPENVAKMNNLVIRMDSINKKLLEKGKYLYVYIAPSKADLCPETMPKQYVNMAEEGAVNAVDLFREMIGKTEVPVLFCSDLANGLEYPAFYSTGIHWSRPYEQMTSKHIVEDLSEITGKEYRNISLKDIETSKKSFWRDTDVYDLLNVWDYPDVEYYQYKTEVDSEIPKNSLRLMMYADSFGEGLPKDIKGTIPEHKIHYINRCNYVVDADGNTKTLGNDWNNLDWQYFLDNSDVVVIEIVEPEIVRMTNGFVDYLDTYLDTYEQN